MKCNYSILVLRNGEPGCDHKSYLTELKILEMGMGKSETPNW